MSAGGGGLYLIALGSNQRHGRFGPPAAVLGAALRALAEAGCRVLAAAPVVASAPVGPSRRVYANGAAVVACDAAPDVLLARMKAIEARFGRRCGQRWGTRVLDLDIVLWSGGRWRSGARSAPMRARGAGWGGWLAVPHPAYAGRDFVLGPAARVAPAWRDPVNGRTVRQLAQGRRSSLSKPRCHLRQSVPSGGSSNRRGAQPLQQAG